MKKDCRKWFKVNIWGLILILIFLTACARKPQQLDISSIPVYDISAVPDAEIIERYLTEQGTKNPLIIKVPNGYVLPIHLDIDTPLAKLDSDAGNLVFTTDLYLYINERNILTSPDTARWAPFSDMEMVKKLFGADKGSLSLGMSATAKEGAQLSVKVMLTPAEKVNH